MEYAPLLAALWFLLFIPLLTEKEQGKRKKGVGAYSAVTAAQGPLQQVPSMECLQHLLAT